MPDPQFRHINPFSFSCWLDGQQIGTVSFTPQEFYSWTFRNCLGNVETFGSTKVAAVRLYLSLFKEVS